jgi:hypothetical protein
MNTENKLPEDFKQRWVAALRSGEYEQGKNELHRDDKFCCLGVACVVAGYTSDQLLTEFIPKDFDKVPVILVDEGDIPTDLANMNDRGQPFSEIADYIEQNL